MALNEKGKLRHRFHALFFRRGETPEQDVLIAHYVGRHSVMGRNYQRKVRRWIEQIRRMGHQIDYAEIETEDYRRQQKAIRRESYQ